MVLHKVSQIRANYGCVMSSDFRKDLIWSPTMAISFYFIILLQHLEIMETGKKIFKIKKNA